MLGFVKTLLVCSNQHQNFEKGCDKGHSQEIPKPRVLKLLTR